MDDLSIIKRPSERGKRTLRVEGHTITTGKPLLKDLTEARKKLGTSSHQQTIKALYDFWRLNR